MVAVAPDQHVELGPEPRDARWYSSGRRARLPPVHPERRERSRHGLRHRHAGCGLGSRAQRDLLGGTGRLALLPRLQPAVFGRSRSGRAHDGNLRRGHRDAHPGSTMVARDRPNRGGESTLPRRRQAGRSRATHSRAAEDPRRGPAAPTPCREPGRLPTGSSTPRRSGCSSQPFTSSCRRSTSWWPTGLRTCWRSSRSHPEGSVWWKVC